MGYLTILFMTTTIQLDLPPNLLSSLCYIESKHDIHAVHRNDGLGDSLGACQIKLATARDLGFKGSAKQLMKPKTNIHYAGLYLKKQITRYQGSIERGVIAYNFGNARGLTSSKYQVRVFKYWRHNGSNRYQYCRLER